MLARPLPLHHVTSLTFPLPAQMTQLMADMFANPAEAGSCCSSPACSPRQPPRTPPLQASQSTITSRPPATRLRSSLTRLTATGALSSSTVTAQ